jgi:hypothetical protein
MNSSPELRERFLREARVAATLKHPNICQVYDVGEIDGRLYLTMEYVEGKTLSTYLKKGKPQPGRQAAALLCRLALTLQEAHTRGVIHRDLKPSNVMLNARNEPVVMDFGLARREGDIRMTRSGLAVGTPAYMSPEQLNGEANAGPASDQYSLGVILYELLTGRLPFEGPLMAVLAQKATQDPEPPSRRRPDLDPRLEAICLKAMARNAEDRYGSMKELAEGLVAYLRASRKPTDSSTTIGTLPSMAHDGKGREGGRRLRRTPSVAAMSGLLLLGVLVLLVAFVFKLRTAEGTIVVTVNEPGAEIHVNGELIEITRPGSRDPVMIRRLPGKYKVEVKKKDFQVVSRDVTLTRNGRDVVAVRLEPLPAARADPAEPEPSRPAAPVESRFARGDGEGWYTLNHDDNGGATGHVKVREFEGNFYLEADDHQNGKEWGWHAPAKFHGDHADQFGRYLRYDMWTSHVDPPPVTDWLVRLQGAGMTLFQDGTSQSWPPARVWHTYSIRLAGSGGWKVFPGGAPATDEDVKKVLANVTDLRLKAEFSGKRDRGCLDNVVFGADG